MLRPRDPIVWAFLGLASVTVIFCTLIIAQCLAIQDAQRRNAVQINKLATTVEFLAHEEAARKVENERSKADRAQLNARQARAEADRRAIEVALRQIGEIREVVDRVEKRVVGERR